MANSNTNTLSAIVNAGVSDAAVSAGRAEPTELNLLLNL